MTMPEIKNIVKTATLAMLLIVPILLIFSAKNVSASFGISGNELVEVRNAWQYLVPGTETWAALDYASKPPINGGKTAATLKVRLPDTYLENRYLFVQCRDQNLEVSGNGKILYTYGEINSMSRTWRPGSPWHVVPLSNEWRGKEIQLRTLALVPEKYGDLAAVYLGSRASFVVSQLKADMKDTIPGFTLISIGICILLIFLSKRRRVTMTLPLALFSISMGMFTLSMTSITNTFLYDNPVFWYYLSYIAEYLTPVFFFMAVRQLFPTFGNKVLFFIWMAFLILVVFALVADVSGVLPFPSTYPLFMLLIIPTVFIIGVLIFNTSSAENSHIRTLRNGFAALLVTGIADAVIQTLKFDAWRTTLSNLGVLIFLFTLLNIFEKNFHEAEEKIASFSIEIRQKDATLVANQQLLEKTLENDKLKNEFFANISHDFRTPLNILLSNLQLMNHYVKNGEIISETRDVNRYMGIMKQNCYRLLRLINNIIDITKIDSGFLQPVMKNCDIVIEIQEIVHSIFAYAESKNIALHFHSDQESVICAYDPEKIERIMLNLLSNAIKFTGKGGTITVAMICLPEQLRILVSDTGIGIPQDKLSSVFDRFSQVDMSLSKSYEGSGIGLSLVRSLVEMHGGTITVQSELSRGSEFIITLPITLVRDDISGVPSVSARQNFPTDNINIEFSDITK